MSKEISAMASLLLNLCLCVVICVVCYLYKGVRAGYYFTVDSSVNSSVVDEGVARNLGKVLLEYWDKRLYNENYIVAEYNENLKIWEVYYTIYNENEVNIGGYE